MSLVGHSNQQVYHGFPKSNHSSIYLSKLAKFKNIDADDLKKIASHPNANITLLQTIVNDPKADSEILRAVAGNKNASSELLEKIVRENSEDLELLKIVLDNKNTNAKVVSIILEKDKQDTDKGELSKFNGSIGILTKIATIADVEGLKIIASHPNADSEVLNAVAGNPNVDVDGLKAIASHPNADSKVLNVVASNQNAGLEVLKAVLENKNADAAVVNTILKRDADRLDGFLGEEAPEPLIDQEMLTKMAAISDIAGLKKIIENPIYKDPEVSKAIVDNIIKILNRYESILSKNPNFAANLKSGFDEIKQIANVLQNQELSEKIVQLNDKIDPPEIVAKLEPASVPKIYSTVATQTEGAPSAVSTSPLEKVAAEITPKLIDDQNRFDPKGFAEHFNRNGTLEVEKAEVGVDVTPRNIGLEFKQAETVTTDGPIGTVFKKPEEGATGVSAEPIPMMHILPQAIRFVSKDSDENVAMVVQQLNALSASNWESGKDYKISFPKCSEKDLFKILCKINQQHADPDSAHKCTVEIKPTGRESAELKAMIEQHNHNAKLLKGGSAVLPKIQLFDDKLIEAMKDKLQSFAAPSIPKTDGAAGKKPTTSGY